MTVVDRIRAANEAVSIYELLERAGQRVDSSRPRKIFCPVHSDENKSAMVYPESNEIWCFTCHQTYDPVGLLVELDGMSTSEACRWIEENVGIVYERRSRPQDRFWELARTHEKRLLGEPVSAREAYQLRWEIHRTVLELGIEVDWTGFDEAGLDLGKLRDWQKGVMRGDPGTGRVAGDSRSREAARGHAAMDLDEGQEGRDPSGARAPGNAGERSSDL